MLSAEEKRALHQLENELLIHEEEKRHLMVREQAILQEGRVLETTLARAARELEQNKAEKLKLTNLLHQTEEAIQRLRIKIKNAQ